MDIVSSDEAVTTLCEALRMRHVRSLTFRFNLEEIATVEVERLATESDVAALVDMNLEVGEVLGETILLRRKPDSPPPEQS